ncbi:uncharacterized protein LOC132735165 [Ruditapes philippinarum]|uniref:uncharacterized protein LOC132735165 n=1 Tax=Ruditapes philippinarum TaxID=129788 RepID=UPI00295A630C|nr:uncharacterized protein LOC132735165 [Ruditapes philippinarum]
MELKDKILFYCVLTTILKDVLGALECSQCVSDELEDCAINPPPAKPCNAYQANQKGPVNCMKAKKTNTSGYLIQFIRGCTGVWTGSGCMPQADKTMLCYEICSTSNCNAANDSKISIIKCLLYLIYIIIGMTEI